MGTVLCPCGKPGVYFIGVSLTVTGLWAPMRPAWLCVWRGLIPNFLSHHLINKHTATRTVFLFEDYFSIVVTQSSPRIIINRRESASQSACVCVGENYTCCVFVKSQEFYRIILCTNGQSIFFQSKVPVFPYWIYLQVLFLTSCLMMPLWAPCPDC